MPEALSRSRPAQCERINATNRSDRFTLSQDISSKLAQTNAPHQYPRCRFTTFFRAWPFRKRSMFSARMEENTRSV